MTRRRVVVATGNRGKLAEIRTILAPLGLELIAQSELGIEPADETACTFIENALLKARAAANTSGLPAIADDSGLEVAALGGAPGVYSARYAGVHGDDDANNRKLLAELAARPNAGRHANFRCTAVYLRHAEDPAPLIAEGLWQGEIADQPRGTNGFGYDPLFLVPAEGLTAAELDAERKNKISHRAQAFRLLHDRLQKP